MPHEELTPHVDDAAFEQDPAVPASAILKSARPVRMTNRQKDIVRALASLMWVDGNANPAERAIIEGVLDELGPSPDERAEMQACLDGDVTVLEDVELERLTDDEKQVLLTHAVLLSLADDVQLPTEKALLARLIERLALPGELVQTILEDAHEDRAVSLPGSALEAL